jgi:hypothetical protein
MTRVLLVGVVFMFSGGASVAPTKDKPAAFWGLSAATLIDTLE